MLVLRTPPEKGSTPLEIPGTNTRIGKSLTGFTIIELIVAIGIFGIVMPALAAGINNLTVLNNRARDLTLANLIAESKAELLRNTGYNSLNPGPTPYTISFTNELPPELASPKSAEYTISQPQTGLAEIEVNISYKDYSQTKTVNYKTIVSELGVGQ